MSVGQRDRGSFLKRRALAFLEDARSDFMREEYDLVLFHVEQFVQLYLKHLLYLRLGDFLRTRSPSELFKLLARVYNREEVMEFYRENLEMLELLEDAYISSRYLPRTFSREVAERALALSERLLEVFSWLEGDLIDLLLELRKEKERYYADPLRYARAIKDVVRSFDADARVYLFGSYVRGTMRPDSDIDVLVVTREASDVWRRVRIRVEVKRVIGDLTPFEIHLVTPEEFEVWYRRFIDVMLEVE